MTAEGSLLVERRVLVRSLRTELSARRLAYVAERVIALRSPWLVPCVEISQDGAVLRLVSQRPLGPTWGSCLADGRQISAAEAVDAVTRVLLGLHDARHRGLSHGALTENDVHLAPDGALLAWCGAADLAGDGLDPDKDVADALRMLLAFTEDWPGTDLSPASLAGRLIAAPVGGPWRTMLELTRTFGRPFAAATRDVVAHRGPRWHLEEPDVTFHDPSVEPELFDALRPRSRATSLFLDPVPPDPAPPARHRPRPRRRRSLVLLAASLSAVALAAAAAWVWFAPDRTDGPQLTAGAAAPRLDVGGPAPVPLPGSDAPPVIALGVPAASAGAGAALADPVAPEGAATSAAAAVSGRHQVRPPHVQLSPVEVSGGANVAPLLRGLDSCGLDLRSAARSSVLTELRSDTVTIYRQDAVYADSDARHIVEVLRGAPSRCPDTTAAGPVVPSEWSVSADEALQPDGGAALLLTGVEPSTLPFTVVATRPVHGHLTLWVATGLRGAPVVQALRQEMGS